MSKRSKPINELTERATSLYSSNRFVEAIELFDQLLNLLEAEGDVDMHRRAIIFRLRGIAFYRIDKFKESLKSFKQAIDFLSSVSDNKEYDLLLTNILSCLSLNYDTIGDSRRAEGIRKKIMDILKDLVNLYPEGVANIIIGISNDMESFGLEGWRDHVFWLNNQINNLSNIVALRILVRLHEFWYEKDNEDAMFRVLANALDHIRLLNNKQIIEFYSTIHSIVQAALRSRHLEITNEIVDRIQSVKDLLNKKELYSFQRILALTLSASGNHHEALDLFQSAYQLALDMFGFEDKRTRISMQELADILYSLEDRNRAIELYYKALEIEKNIDDDPIRMAEMAYTLGRLLDDDSQYERSIDVHQLALSIRVKYLGTENLDTKYSCYEVAELSRVLNRFEESEYYFLKAREMDIELNRPDKVLSSRICNNLGEVYLKIGRYEEARTLILEALHIRENAFGENDELTWRSRRSLTHLALLEGDSQSVVQSAREALTRKNLFSDSDWYLLLAGGLLMEGEIEESLSIYKTLHIPQEDVTAGVWIEVYLDVLKGLMHCYTIQKNWLEVIKLAFEGYKSTQIYLPDIVKASSEDQMVRYAKKALLIQSLWLNSLINYQAKTADQLEQAFKYVQFNKGLLTRYLRWRIPGLSNVRLIHTPEHQASIQNEQAELRNLYKELTEAFINSENSKSSISSMELLRKRTGIREYERNFASRIYEEELILETASIGTKNLIPENAMVIEFIVISDSFFEEDITKTCNRKYAAFVIGPSQKDTMKLLDLGLCEGINVAVSEMRDSIMCEQWIEENSEPAWVRLSRYLGRKILKPIYQRLSLAHHLLIAPDGELGSLPFELLSMPDSSYLLDNIRVSYLSRTSELLRFKELFRIGVKPMVLAGPDFDLSNAIIGPRYNMGVEHIFNRMVEGEARFEPLPEAKLEGESIAKMLDVDPLLGIWALAPELLRDRSPEILHLSTHGFCFPLERTLNDVMVLIGPLSNSLDRRMVLEDPMQRSGLVMSGINAVLDGRSIPVEAGEGVVYASEIMQMNLQNTDLVVLSACRSGLGEIEIGDGAHGLRRAFLAAGCRSVISAIWDIPEKSSRKLMESFYSRILKGTTRYEALAQARAEIRSDYPRDPVHWAGFILDGCFDSLWRFSKYADFKIASLSLAEWRLNDKGNKSSKSIYAVDNISDAVNKNSNDYGILELKAISNKNKNKELKILGLSKLGDLANRLGDSKQSLDYYNAILEIEDLTTADRAIFTWNVAKILHQSGDLEEGIIGYSKVLDLQPTTSVRIMTLVNRGHAFFSNNQIEEAISDYTSVIEDTNAPKDQRFIAYKNRSVALKTDNPNLALLDIEAAIGLGVANETESILNKIHRIGLLITLENFEIALKEIDLLEQNTNLSEKVQGWLRTYRFDARQAMDKIE